MKCRQALLVVQRAAAVLDDAELAGGAERVLAQAHELAEIRVLNELRRVALALPGDGEEVARRLLGEHGLAPAVRVGLDEGRPAPR